MDWSVVKIYILKLSFVHRSFFGPSSRYKFRGMGMIFPRFSVVYGVRFLWKNDAKAETPILWPPHVKGWFIGKDSDAGRDWGQEEKGTTEDEMAGWHQWLDRCESQWTPRVGDEQGGLACCDSWGCRELDTTERLIWSDLMLSVGRILWICFDH